MVIISKRKKRTEKARYGDEMEKDSVALSLKGRIVFYSTCDTILI